MQIQSFWYSDKWLPADRAPYNKAYREDSSFFLRVGTARARKRSVVLVKNFLCKKAALINGYFQEITTRRLETLLMFSSLRNTAKPIKNHSRRKRDTEHFQLVRKPSWKCSVSAICLSSASKKNCTIKSQIIESVLFLGWAYLNGSLMPWRELCSFRNSCVTDVWYERCSL